MTQNYYYGLQTSYTLHSSFAILLYSYYVNDMIKKIEIVLLAVLILLNKTVFGYAQISVPKISIPISKTVCVNPY